MEDDCWLDQIIVEEYEVPVVLSFVYKAADLAQHHRPLQEHQVGVDLVERIVGVKNGSEPGA